MKLVLKIALGCVAAMALSAQQPDFNYYRAKVEPIFTSKRPTHARCIVCHTGRTAFNLQPLAKGVTVWTEAESRKNYEMLLKNVVNVGKPEVSPLLVHPLAETGGGDEFHSGGRQFMDKMDPNWQTLNNWIRGAK